MFARTARPRPALRAARTLPAVLTLAAVLSLAAGLSGCGADPAASATSDTAPPYYAETIAIRPPAYDSPLNVSIRATATGGESAALRALPPYESIGFVAGTAKPNWWIVGAQRWRPVQGDNSAQPAKLYLATMTATTVDGNPFNEDALAPLPVAPLQAAQLSNGTAAGSGARQLAAATVAPDGKRFALVTTQASTYQVSVYPVTGHAAARTWAGRVSPGGTPFQWGFSLTWLSDDKTLAVGVTTRAAAAGGTALVHYLDTSARGGSLVHGSRTVTLSFPAGQAKTGTPDACYRAPVATSDGQRVLCAGTAAYPVNSRGAAEAGLWLFSARTGALTAAWNRHTFCCSLASTGFPRILWVSPHGTQVIASGLTTDNQGARLSLRRADGTLQQLPWKGLVRRPDLASIREPSIAW